MRLSQQHVEIHKKLTSRKRRQSVQLFRSLPITVKDLTESGVIAETWAGWTRTERTRSTLAVIVLLTRVVIEPRGTRNVFSIPGKQLLKFRESRARTRQQAYQAVKVNLSRHTCYRSIAFMWLAVVHPSVHPTQQLQTKSAWWVV